MKPGYLNGPIILILALITFSVAVLIYFNSRLIVKNKPAPSPVVAATPETSPQH